MADDYDIAAAVRKIEDEVIASMIRNLDHHRAEEDKEGINWEQWQVKQLAALEEFKKRNAAKYGDIFDDINSRIESLIKMQRAAGHAEQEVAILEALQKGAKPKKVSRRQTEINARFFLANDRKINALIQATTADMQKAEYAILRMANDKYRKIIFDAQMYAASGAGTYETAVDMATKDFLRAGINCVEYSNGARHTASDYADMAIRTASKRAYLTGEGESRRERGITTVIMNKRGNACPKCLPFVGKVLIDDVWSGGSSRDGPYPLMSTAIAAGLYHPRCKDIHSTYFPGISTPPDDVFTKEELADIEAKAKKEAERQYAKRQAESYDRLAKYSMDESNRKMYAARAKEWEKVAKITDTGIMEPAGTNEVADVHTVGSIDRNIYKCITEKIRTDEVIITDERIGHIIERRGNEFYNKYHSIFGNILKDPDYIFKDKHENSALVCKRIVEDKKYVNIVLRIVVETDNPKYKNSILTAIGEGERRFCQRLKNNEPLYKKE